jgi:hypothetical protein
VKIVIQIPACEIKIAYEDLNFKKIEEEVLSLMKATGRDIVKNVIKVVDEEEQHCRGKGLTNKGYKGNTKYLTTVFGDVQYCRRRYQEKGKKESRYLCDEKLGLGKRQTDSPVKQKLEIEAAVDARSYRKAAAQENRWTGISRSHESIRQRVIREGGLLEARKETEIRGHEVGVWSGEACSATDTGSSTKNVLYVEADATYLSRQSRKDKAGKREQKGRKLEVKLGIMYGGHEQRYSKGKGRQQRLREKQVYIGFESGDEFMRKLSIVSDMKYDLSAESRFIVGGDGAAWIKTGTTNYFLRSTYVLCKFHLHRALKRGLGYNKDLEKQIKELLYKDRIDEVVKKITTAIKKTSRKNRRKIKKLKELRSYILSNREGINAIERLRQQVGSHERRLICRTGAIEGNIDKIIAQRLKGRGMSWSAKGAMSLLAVIGKMQNSEWDEWWARERDKKVTINEEASKEYETVTFWRDSKKQEPGIMTVSLPALDGPHQDKVWVGILRDTCDGVKSLQ